MKTFPAKILMLILLATLVSTLSSSSSHATAAASISVTYAGVYSPSLTYAKGNVVKYGNCTYLALGTIATNASPGYRPSAWTLFGALPENNTFGTGSNTFTLEFVTIGNPGNSNNITAYGNFGSVPYSYQIGTYAISQNQINFAISNGLAGFQGVSGTTWSGDKPATGLGFIQVLLYVNWLNTSQGYSPAYNISNSSSNYSIIRWPTNQVWTNGGTNFYRNANCVYFLPSENEWYKAAYFDPNKNGLGMSGYWPYAVGCSNPPNPVASGTNAGSSVVCQSYQQGPASVFLSGGLSPYGTMGQGGNVCEWLENAILTNPISSSLVSRGVYWCYDNVVGLRAYNCWSGGWGGSWSTGFRVGRILP